MSVICVAGTHYYSQAPTQTQPVQEPKKNDFETQKIFLLSFSHEIRNLINSLLGNIKIANLEHVNPRLKELLTSAELCGELLMHLVNNIMDTGKAEVGDLEINNSPTRIYDTMESVWKVASELIQRKGLKGRMKINRNVPKVVQVDPYRLTQIVLNLVENAVKFTERGLIDISVEWISDNSQVSDKCFEPIPFNNENDQDEGLFEKNQAMSVLNENHLFLNSPYVKVSRNISDDKKVEKHGVLKIVVSDTGCGLSKEDISKLFNKFNHMNSNDARRQLSTGLGLSVTKALCERMGGEIRVYSIKEKGSSFSICVPVEPVNNGVRDFMQLEHMKNLIAPKGLKAMVVDDVPFNRLVLKDFMTKIGIEVTETAENGEIAANRYTNNLGIGKKLNIVTMDLDMPIMDGKQAAQKIREFEAANNIDPCLMIIVSGNCSESEVKLCMDNGGSIRADAFLKKPVSIEDLFRVVQANYNEPFERKSPRHHTV